MRYRPAILKQAFFKLGLAVLLSAGVMADDTMPTPKKIYTFPKIDGVMFLKYFVTAERVFAGSPHFPDFASDTGAPLIVIDSISGDARPISIPNQEECVLAPIEAGTTCFYFVAVDFETNETALWILRDGEDSPELLHIFPLLDAPLSTNPFYRTAATVGNTLFFRVPENDMDGNEGAALWKSDGTDSGTKRLASFSIGNIHKDINFSSSFLPCGMFPLGNRLIFNAYDESRGLCLWASDGTPEGTKAVLDLDNGAVAGYPPESISVSFVLGSSQKNYILMKVKRGIFFPPSGDFNSSEYTPDNYLLDEAEDGVITAHPVNHTSYWPSVRIDGYDYNLTNNDPFLADLIKVDAATHEVTGIGLYNLPPAYISNGAAVNGKLLFGLDADNGAELWAFDPATGQAEELKDIYPGPNSSMLDSLGADPMTGQAIATCGGYAYFSADDGVHDVQMWRSDGTPENTQMVTDFIQRKGYGYITPFACRGKLYFHIYDTRATTPKSEQEQYGLFVIDHNGGKPSPAIKITADTQMIEEGASFSLGVQAAELTGHLSYEWYKDGVSLQVFDPTLEIRNAGPLHAGNYVVQVYDDAKTLYTSSPYRVTILPPTAVPVGGKAYLIAGLMVLGILALRSRRQAFFLVRGSRGRSF